jgi:hypothetical protein
MAPFSKLPSRFDGAVMKAMKILGRRAGLLIVVAGLGILALSSLYAQSQRGSDFAVVVNPDTPVTDLSLEDVRKIFLGDRQYWTAKIPVMLLIGAPGTPERDVALRLIYQMDEVQYKRYWIAKIFRAESTTAPKAVYSDQMANELTTSISGAIAVIDARDVGPGVKVIRIDGHLPGQPDYSLK